MVVRLLGIKHIIWLSALHDLPVTNNVAYITKVRNWVVCRLWLLRPLAQLRTAIPMPATLAAIAGERSDQDLPSVSEGVKQKTACTPR
jgi:hypothetical protein